VGSIGAIGSELVEAKWTGAPSRRLGLSCKTSDSRRKKIGAHIAVREKSRTIFQQSHPGLTPTLVGTAWAIGLERAVARAEAACAPLKRLGLSCKASDSSRKSNGAHIAGPDKSRTIFQQSHPGLTPTLVGTEWAIGLERAVARAEAACAPLKRLGLSCKASDSSRRQSSDSSRRQSRENIAVPDESRLGEKAR